MVAFAPGFVEVVGRGIVIFMRKLRSSFTSVFFSGRASAIFSWPFWSNTSVAEIRSRFGTLTPPSGLFVTESPPGVPSPKGHRQTEGKGERGPAGNGGR